MHSTGFTPFGRWKTSPLPGDPCIGALVHAYGLVKLAAARTNHELGHWDEAKAAAIEAACQEMSEGRLDPHVVVDALQGGAGTSTNMNVNEVLANRALQLLGQPLGDYDTVSPADDINLHQSTNDTYPTALKVAAIFLLRQLEEKVVGLQEAFRAARKTVRRRRQGRPDPVAGRRAGDPRTRDGRSPRPSTATAGGSTSARSDCAW